MSLDITHRPWAYGQVLGQGPTITILKQFVASGRGFEQSYLFCGGRGQGKTTLGRILARALLCEHAKDGEPCDQCVSCLSMLKDGSSLDYTEVDAATNSGKADVDRIKEEIQYLSVTGRQHIYLFDEAHQLSKEALDALLKPLEDNVPGSEDKRLVCIFCTTEPEKMRATVLSRCAPAFIIEPQSPEIIATRFAQICDQENIPYELDALQLIAEITECHVRDGLKAVEGVSMLGRVDKANVAAYLHLDLNSTYLDILAALGQDLSLALDLAKSVMHKASPSVCYERLADAAMTAFRAHLGVKEPSHWPSDRIQALSVKGSALLGYVDRMAGRPGRPTPAMLLCDLAMLHHGGGGVGAMPIILQAAPVVAPVVQIAPLPSAPPTTAMASPVVPASVPTPAAAPASPAPPASGKVGKSLMDDPTSPYYTRMEARSDQSRGVEKQITKGYGMEPELFCNLLALSLAELRSLRSGSPG